MEDKIKMQREFEKNVKNVPKHGDITKYYSDNLKLFPDYVINNIDNIIKDLNNKK